MKFIQINNRILDEVEYNKQCSQLQRLLIEDVAELVRMYGFARKKSRYYNKDLDLEITITIKKKHAPTYV